jgi:hypothetical protein
MGDNGRRMFPVEFRRTGHLKLLKLSSVNCLQTSTFGNAARIVYYIFNIYWRANITFYVGFKVLTAVVMKSSVFWDITSCSPVKVDHAAFYSPKEKSLLHFDTRSRASVNF